MIDPVHLRTCAPQQEKPLQWEAQVLQLEKTHTQQQRPSTVKKKKNDMSSMNDSQELLN